MIEIVHSDALAFLRDLPTGSADAVVSDPPFGIGFDYDEGKELAATPEDYWAWFEPVYREIERVVRPEGFIAIWQTTKYFKYFWTWFGDDIRIYISAKNFVQLRKTPLNYAYDPVIISRLGQMSFKPPRNVDYFVSNTAKWVTETDSLAKQHPCPRPLDQVIELLTNFTETNALVVDPFSGSGTTAVACNTTGRRFKGCDRYLPYVELARKRVDEEGGTLF